ncbi:G-type lectin S-receptor-like serine/threonine-protein kinase At4g27290 [Abrus precatorius]|uniref:G-type lectin S-receptor-like serine/threonine-protein kinase At4g27290 n=1 Tax=Abrus precatorius TaxID=3816 RepID=A0A8B8KGH9_ABRPR|nr:G-type lectin S-receptor-like serine/threonine-protein kinase At4g27290 [Abrus precatorius]
MDLGMAMNSVTFLNWQPFYLLTLRLCPTMMKCTTHTPPKNKSSITRVVLYQPNYAHLGYTWIEKAQSWRLNSIFPGDKCDYCNLCGSFGICDMDKAPLCNSILGFRPKSPHDWDTMDWTQGCMQSRSWSCREKNKDGFRKLNSIKLPDTRKNLVDASMTLEECKTKCWQICSCTAYANLNIAGGRSGCVIWFD